MAGHEAGRTLVVIRHAKSAWPPGTDDDQRPLNGRGVRDAPAVGRWLVEQDLVPDFAFVSPAVRTQETWRLLSAQLPVDVLTATADEIYAAFWPALLDVVRTASDDHTRVALVGHNPGCEDFVLRLAGPGSDPGLVTRAGDKYPTAGTSVLQFEGPWADLVAGGARLTQFAAPRG